MADLEQQIISLSLRTVLVASIVLILGVALAVAFKKQKRLKLPLFLLMAGILIISTAILFGGTVYLNNKSESKGPVHWHTDIEFWACGAELELRDPQGALSNKIGTSTFHEHNDKRLHLEGVVVRKSEDASLEKFMRVTGGYLTNDSVAIPLNEKAEEWFVKEDGIDGDPQLEYNFEAVKQFIKSGDKGPYAEFKNGDFCGSQPAELQVFVYSFDKDSKTYSQRKLQNPTDYVMRDESVVPPGDCVIVEFYYPAGKTSNMCQQYGVRDQNRCMEFGVKEYNPELCNIREVDSEGGL